MPRKSSCCQAYLSPDERMLRTARRSVFRVLITGAMQRMKPTTNSATMPAYTSRLDMPLRALEKNE